MFEEIKENPVKYLKSLAMDILVALVGVAYVFYQMVDIEPTTLNPLTLLAGAIVGIICGVLIKQALGENGFTKGYNSAVWSQEIEKYNESCNSAMEHIPLVDNFYLFTEKEKKENFRRVKLQAIRLRYQDWFDKYGNYIGTKEAYDKLDRKQKRGIRKAINVKVYVLNIFSEYAVGTNNPKEKEISDKDQRRRNFSKNTISAVLIAIIGVYFIPTLNEWSWASLIASSLQVALWVLFGVMQLYTNYNFVVQDKVAILRKKKEMIAKFIKGANEGLYNHPPYYEEEHLEEEKDCATIAKENMYSPLDKICNSKGELLNGGN